MVLKCADKIIRIATEHRTAIRFQYPSFEPFPSSPVMRKISEIPEPDRPREKLLKKGADSLPDIELVAILLGKGTQKQDVESNTKKYFAAIILELEIGC